MVLTNTVNIQGGLGSTQRGEKNHLIRPSAQRRWPAKPKKPRGESLSAEAVSPGTKYHFVLQLQPHGEGHWEFGMASSE